MDKKKKINWFKITIVFLFIAYISLYALNMTGYYNGSMRKKVEFTESQIREFEKDVALGEKVDINDYLEKQTKDYIDEKIRNNKDVKVYAQDGTELTITKNTSGKATFRNEVRQADGTTRRLTDKEFASKLRAETHIDELGKVSRHKNGPVEDTKAHNFAKDGFTYRNAYFEDIDGQYYKITMSVGKNGDINTIYNV